MLKKTISILFVLVCLSACGGGGGGNVSEPRLPTPPVFVTAGGDISVNELEQTNISGAASGGSGEFTFAWSAPEGIEIVQAASSSPDAVLTAPVATENTSFDIVLTATDSDGKSGNKAFTLTVLPVNILPQAIINISKVDGYADGSYPVNIQVSFDGSASFDEDPQIDEPDIAAYLWQQVAGQDVLSGVDTTLATLTFTTPNTTAVSNAQFMLTVTDQEGGQANARTSITLVGQQGTLPDIDAGPDLELFSGEQITLSGSASSLAPNAAPFVASWQHDHVSGLSINDAQALNTFAVAPMVASTTTINFELRVFDQFDNQVSDFLSVKVHPHVNTAINDTGVMVFGAGDSLSSAYQDAFPGQDAQYGRDRMNASDALDKAGRGEDGFDFTRLNANGDPVDDIDLPFSCVRDNITGLIWEIKTQNVPGDLHDADQLFTWYLLENNGNFRGEINEASESCNITSQQCNISAFVDAVNSAGLCGFFDWRIPTHYEMQSLMHYGKTQPPLLDTDYFPHAGTPNNGQLWYWTRQSFADGLADDVARNAWAIDFATGIDNFLSKSGEYRLRLVRAGRRQQ
jgi:hypothetical protein